MRHDLIETYLHNMRCAAIAREYGHIGNAGMFLDRALAAFAGMDMATQCRAKAAALAYRGGAQ
jgi:hypothetical protein